MSTLQASALNLVLAANLREMADLLEQQNADGFRVTAYRKAASTVDALDIPVDEILSREGREGLIALPNIGTRIASALAEMVVSGHCGQLERLRGSTDPEKIFRTIPGIGPVLARKLAENLQVETLEALEIAAHDGTLERLDGIGPRRAQMIRVALSERLGRPRLRHSRAAAERPDIDMLLDVDREYREKAAAGVLRLIAPKRLNPAGKAWLPILHTERGEWIFTALYSNTLLAHRLGRTKDWVVIHYHTDTSPEGQCTVVTEATGPAAGRRVVRGRELECDQMIAAA